MSLKFSKPDICVEIENNADLGGSFTAVFVDYTFVACANRMHKSEIVIIIRCFFYSRWKLYLCI